MCLAIPGQVIDLVDETNGQLALVDVAGARRRINVGLLEEGTPVAAGDWILIHMGFALSIVDEAEAARALGGLHLMGNAANEAVLTTATLQPQGDSR